MSISPGTRFGAYEVGDSIGAGGMGEVYRATDTELKRDVAVKVLPQAFVDDTDRLSRFQREAEILASLNHPNIAQVYGLERADGQTAIVMELIEGPTLAERIKDGPIPPDEAMNIAMQVVSALEAAHERQIVHRDLKPANIKLKDDGTVKVLDFGISRPIDPKAISGSPVMTTPAVTETGIILGTAAYMSPEQARGKFVDQRTDIWAFGCLLFEMLTGQPAFGGEDVMLTLARVLDRDTDLSSIPKTISPAVRHTLELCLEKDPKNRISDIRDVRHGLEGRLETEIRIDGPGDAGSRRAWAWPIVAAVIAVILTSAVAWVSWPSQVPRPMNRFPYNLPEGQTLRNFGRPAITVSPDGRHFAYNANDGIYLRTMGEIDAQLIEGTALNLSSPVFSPDSQHIAFYSFDGELRRIGIIGGVSTFIADLQTNPYGMSWGSDGTILVGQLDGIYRVSATGGDPQLVVPARDGEQIYGPELLPDGDSVLFSAGSPGNWDTHAILVESLTTGDRTELIRAGSDARYLPTGHIVYAIDDSLFAVAFDADELTVSDNVVPIEQGVMRAGSALTGAAQFGVSDEGTFVYIEGTIALQNNRILWVDRDGGIEEPLGIVPSSYSYPRISVDGRRAALDDRNETNDIWIWDFEAETRTRLQIGDAGGWYPVWTSDDERIAFADGQGLGLRWRASNNTGAVETLLEQGVLTGALVNPYFFSPSGDKLVFRDGGTPNGMDNIGIMTIGENADPVWLLNGGYQERNAELSPNGHWMAYQSNESGPNEIYVRPFPNIDDDQIPISNAGGFTPLWSRDGTELFYLEPTDSGMRLIAVSVEADETSFTRGERRPVLDWPYVTANDGRNYDVSLDGQRFLVVSSGSSDDGESVRMIIVQNWFDEIERRLSPE